MAPLPATNNGNVLIDNNRGFIWKSFGENEDFKARGKRSKCLLGVVGYADGVFIAGGAKTGVAGNDSKVVAHYSYFTPKYRLMEKKVGTYLRSD